MTRIKPYEYARQIWVCTIVTSDNYLKPCDIGGGCSKCKEAELEKQREAEDELERQQKAVIC